MKIKNTFIRLATVVLVLAGGLPLTAVADKVVKIDQRFAGAFITSAVLPSALIHVTAVGSPGRAEIRGFSGVDTIFDFVVGCLGSSDLLLQIDIDENPLVFTFKDLSLLFAKGGSGTICIDVLGTGLVDFEINIMFDGGRGRFEGATGQAVITGEAEPVSADASFLAETGTVVGTIILP